MKHEKKQQVVALGRLGWSLRRIEEETGVRRETASRYLRAAGIPTRRPGRWGHAQAPQCDPKAAIEVSTDSAPAEKPARSPTASACTAYADLIEEAVRKGRTAMAIWQDLVDDHGFTSQYASVRRFVNRLRGASVEHGHPVIETGIGEEAQVDYGSGPMVRDPSTGKYRRTRLFVLTLGYSRKSVRLLVFRSSTRIFAELHERAFRRLGGSPRVLVLDNLREGVLAPDIYEPVLNPLFADVLTHYGVVALPCRVRDPNRKRHVWRAIISNRVKGRGCPRCAGQLRGPEHSFAVRKPGLARYWDPERNGDRTPFDVACHSRTPVWWRCPKGPDHAWRAAPASRMQAKNHCPFCARRRLSITNSLATLAPAVAADWHPMLAVVRKRGNSVTRARDRHRSVVTSWRP